MTEPMEGNKKNIGFYLVKMRCS